jgi:hypothetical protein
MVCYAKNMNEPDALETFLSEWEEYCEDENCHSDSDYGTARRLAEVMVKHVSRDVAATILDEGLQRPY